jgi:LysR family transcriptional regulator, transcriptional activator of the cysJI operon
MLSDLERLRVFCKVYEQKGILGAAHILHVTQSAVSQQVKRLEGELGIDLFIRAYHSMTPTREAEELYAAAAPLIEHAENVVQHLAGSKSGLSGRIRVYAPVVYGSNILPAVIARYRQIAPMVEFEITLGRSNQLPQILLENKFDLAFMDGFFGKQKADQRSWYKHLLVLVERLPLVCRSDYFEQNLKGKEILEALHDCVFLDYQPGHVVLRAWISHHFRRRFVPKHTAIVVESVQAVLSGIRQGLGIGMVPEYLLEQDIKNKVLRKIPTPKPDLINHISLVWLRSRKLGAREQNFVEFLAKDSKSLAGKISGQQFVHG